jgi:hypothetical protein
LSAFDAGTFLEKFILWAQPENLSGRTVRLRFISITGLSLLNFGNIPIRRMYQMPDEVSLAMRCCSEGGDILVLELVVGSVFKEVNNHERILMRKHRR